MATQIIYQPYSRVEKREIYEMTVPCIDKKDHVTNDCYMVF